MNANDTATSPHRPADAAISEQNQALAGTESAQSATEYVAFEYEKQLGLCLHIDGRGLACNFSVDKAITPEQARQIAATLLNAADFVEANSKFGKVAA
jgi:hypothetical protein